MSSHKFGECEWSGGDIPVPFEDDESDMWVWESGGDADASQQPAPFEWTCSRCGSRHPSIATHCPCVFEFCCDDDDATGSKEAAA